MSAKCIVIANENNELITQSLINPNWGYILIKTLLEADSVNKELRYAKLYAKKTTLTSNYHIGKILPEK